MEDPKKLTLIGYLIRAFSAPKFYYASNLLIKLSASLVSYLDSKYSAVSALFWDIILKIAPSEVFEDVKQFV